jgi:hypothetical protein
MMVGWLTALRQINLKKLNFHGFFARRIARFKELLYPCQLQPILLGRSSKI